MTTPATTKAVVDDGLLVSTQRAADLLGVSRASIYNLIREDRLDEVRIGDRRLVVRESILELVKRARDGENPLKK